MSCPGTAKLTASLYPCTCGGEVEMFSDEVGIRCKCGNIVRRERVSCLDWCASAEQCKAIGQLKDTVSR